MIEYQRTEHLINGHKVTLFETTPTRLSEMGGVAMEVISADGQPAHMVFSHDGFKLLKAILGQY
jgi:hypothetical protein